MLGVSRVMFDLKCQSPHHKQPLKRWKQDYINSKKCAQWEQTHFRLIFTYFVVPKWCWKLFLHSSTQCFLCHLETLKVEIYIISHQNTPSNQEFCDRTLHHHRCNNSAHSLGGYFNIFLPQNRVYSTITACK